MNKITKSKAWEIVGGLSAPAKMPETSYGLSALRCPTGSKLAKIAGTVCHDCYALKGRYMMPNVSDAHARRQAALDRALSGNNGEWWDYLQAWTVLLHGVRHHRWHDSGDIQSHAHLYMIAMIALATPDTMHWLPTKETKIVQNFKRYWMDEMPKNLIVRLSASKIDHTYGAPDSQRTTSMVYSDDLHVPKTAHKCPIYSDPALKNANCADAGCFACWDPTVHLVAYPQH